MGFFRALKHLRSGSMQGNKVVPAFSKGAVWEKLDTKRPERLRILEDRDVKVLVERVGTLRPRQSDQPFEIDKGRLIARYTVTGMSITKRSDKSK